MNTKKIEEVIRLMENHNLMEVCIEEEGMKIHLKKTSAGEVQKIINIPSAVVTPLPGAPSQAEVPPKEEAKNVVEIKAPMVGTFYRTPAPDTKAYIDIGQTIKEGDILCIIEAMKLMNEIKSEVKGKVVDILVDNGEPVEFGQVLFLVEPA